VLITARPVLSHLNPIRNLTTYAFKSILLLASLLRLHLPSDPFLSGFLTRMFHIQVCVCVCVCVCEYEGVSKSFRTESITKYTLTFGITHCCPLQSIPLPSLWTGSRVSTTAGTDFLELRVGRPASVPEFQ
jgi:hypothetical protein